MRLPYLLVSILVTALLGAGLAPAAGSENVSLLGRFAEGPCLGLEAVDGVAYFGNGAVLEIVVLPAGPTPLGRVTLAGPILGVSVAGGLACVASGTAGLQVVDVSDPTQPCQRGVYLSPGCVEEVAIDGTHVYLAAGEAGLRVVDISDPSAPFEAGFVDTPGYTDDVVVVGEIPADGDIRGLHGIYPNPFNPQVSIDFSLAQPEQVRISVFDPAGRRIAVVAERMFEAGNNSIRWNGRDTSGRAVPSGTYLVRMEAAGLNEARKVTLVR